MSSAAASSGVSLDTAPVVEELLSQYQTKVFTLAMHLLNDPRRAHAVVEEVFLVLGKNQSLPEEEHALEALIHATTYDFAIAELLSIKRAQKAH